MFFPCSRLCVIELKRPRTRMVMKVTKSIEKVYNIYDELLKYRRKKCLSTAMFKNKPCHQ